MLEGLALAYADGLVCIRCGRKYTEGIHLEGCPRCMAAGTPANLAPSYDLDKVRSSFTPENLVGRRHDIWRYHELLPVGAAPRTGGIGWTPLMQVDTGAGRCLDGKCRDIHLKLESQNRSSAFKDRLATVSVAKAKEMGKKGIVLSSSGNQGVACAAEGARQGIPCVVLVPSDITPVSVASLRLFGACVIMAPDVEVRQQMVMAMARERGWFAVTNVCRPPIGSNPWGIEGYKTISFEIAEQLGWEVPDVVVVPASIGDGLWGVWRGFTDLRDLGLVRKAPRMIAAEVIGPLAHALECGLDYVEPVPDRPSRAYSIASSTSAYQALKALKDSGGDSCVVSDEEMVEHARLLARTDGMLVELSSAAGMAATARLMEQGKIGRDERVVVVITSHGSKTVHDLMDTGPSIPRLDEPSLERLEDILGLQS